MAEKASNLSISEMPDKEFPRKEEPDVRLPPEERSSPNNNSQNATEIWREFADNTTLHGFHYIFSKSHILIRLTWLVLLLTTISYFTFTVYRAFNKYYSYPIRTVLSHEHIHEMDFPAVTI